MRKVTINLVPRVGKPIIIAFYNFYDHPPSLTFTLMWILRSEKHSPHIPIKAFCLTNQPERQTKLWNYLKRSATLTCHVWVPLVGDKQVSTTMVVADDLAPLGSLYTNIYQLWDHACQCISNRMPIKVWYEITYPLPNFNGCTVEVWEWINDLISHYIMDVITCCA